MNASGSAEHGDHRGASPQVSVVVACTRPDRIAGIAAALGASDVVCELVVAGDVEGLDPTDWAVPTELVACADRHPNRRRGAALQRTHAPVVAFLDDDAVPEPSWLVTAAELDPASHEIWTGPELPGRSSAGARLAHAVATSPLAEGTRAHVAQGDGEVQWFEAPFCNLVVARKFLDELPTLATDIPWDLDDFALCRDAQARGARFRTRSGLVIAHDRYPDRVGDWLARKAAERRRTGEKLVRYPELYLPLPGAVVAAAAPWAALGLLAAVRSHRRTLLRLGVVGYVVALVVEARRSGARGIDAARFAAGLAGLHVVSLGAMQCGMIDGLVARATGHPDPQLLPPASASDRTASGTLAPSEGATWPAPC